VAAAKQKNCVLVAMATKLGWSNHPRLAHGTERKRLETSSQQSYSYS